MTQPLGSFPSLTDAFDTETLIKIHNQLALTPDITRQGMRTICTF